MLVLASGACQTYRPAPLDLESHRSSWMSRSADPDRLADLARRLAESRPAPDPEFDARNGLSYAEAEAVGLVYNADLRLARLRAQTAAASARYAGLWSDPVFGFEGERILTDVTHPWVAAASFGVTLPFSGRLDAEKREACAEERAAIARVMADEWALRFRLRALWLEWSFQTLRADLTRRLLERLAAIADLATRLEEAGELARIEGRLFRAEQASRRIELRAVEARASEMELELKGLMGLMPDAPLVFQPATSAGPGISAGSSLQVDKNPQMDALRANYEVAEEALRVEIRKQFPDLTIAPGYRDEDGDPRVTLGLEIPLPIWNRNRQAIAEARAKRELARAEFETGYEALVAKLAAARLHLRTATEQRSELESALLPLIDEQSSDVQRIAELGQVNTLVMLDTLVRQHEARLKLLDARLLEGAATVRVQEMLGPGPRHAEESP
jgi:outer membrane protein TolC